MNYTIENPKGIDKEIQRIQTALYNKILWQNFDVYGRVHRNYQETKGLVPQAYIGNNEYRDVFTNDSKTATVFFIDDPEHKTENGFFYYNEIKIVFLVNLSKAKLEVSHRADMEVEIEALKILQNHKIFDVSGIEKGIEKVFSGFNTDGIKLSDMQPYHVFAIIGKLKYTINC